jgi:hypothetical protein
MYQARQQQIDMTRTHEDAKRLVDVAFVGKIGTHMLSCDRKDPEKQKAEYQMKPGHGETRERMI